MVRVTTVLRRPSVSLSDTAWAALLIRRSSVRARRGPLVFVQVRGLQTASDDPEPSLITSKWHIYGTSHGTSCGICGKLPRIGVLMRMFSQGGRTGFVMATWRPWALWREPAALAAGA